MHSDGQGQDAQAVAGRDGGCPGGVRGVVEVEVAVLRPGAAGWQAGETRRRRMAWNQQPAPPRRCWMAGWGDRQVTEEDRR
jgi:hypothetical protein